MFTKVFAQSGGGPVRAAVVCLLLFVSACAPVTITNQVPIEPVQARLSAESYLTIGYGNSDAEARFDALQKALRKAAGSWVSPRYGTNRAATIARVLESRGGEFIRRVVVRSRGQSGPSSFVLAEVEIEPEAVIRALNLEVTGPEVFESIGEPSPADWWKALAAPFKSIFGPRIQEKRYVPELENPVGPNVALAREFMPDRMSSSDGDHDALSRTLTHYYVEPFSRPRDYLLANVEDVRMAPGVLESRLHALDIAVSLQPDPERIEVLNNILRLHGEERSEGARCLVFAPDSQGQRQFYTHRSCRIFTAFYPQSTAMLAINFVGDSGVIASLMVADDPFRVAFGERHLDKLETLYVRHSDQEYAAWAWQPDVRRVRERDHEYHVMPFSILECGEDKVGVCNDWSQRYRVTLGLHGGAEQRVRFIVGNMPTEVLSKTTMILAEVVEVRDGEIISDMLPPGVRLIPDDPPPPLSHPLDEGVFAVGRSY